MTREKATYQNNKTVADSTRSKNPQERNARSIDQILAELPSYESPHSSLHNSAGHNTKPPITYRKCMSPGKKAAIITVFIVLALAFASAYYFLWLPSRSFEYRLRPIVILEGQSVSPSDFFAPYGNSQNVDAHLSERRFSPAPGLQAVPLTLNYNRRTVNTIGTLFVLSPISSITHEYATEAPDLTPLDLISNAAEIARADFDLQFVEAPMPLVEYQVGTHTLHLSLNDTPFYVTLRVVDTTPPTARPVNLTIPMGQPVSPEDFVTDVFDASPIGSFNFTREPDVFYSGEQVAEVVIIDYFGNYYYFHSILTVLQNVTPPTLNIPFTSIDAMLGTPIIFRQGVTAYDSFGRELEINIDSSMVDQHTLGTYTVTYWVEDSCGNRTEATVTVNIIEIDPVYVNERADSILSGVINDDMTQVEKVRAIHGWVRSNVHYAAVRGGPESVYDGAYIALTQRRGNCFIFQAIAEVLLNRADIPNMRVERIPVAGANTTHRWSLVNPDNLGWHHFDAFPVNRALNINAQMYMFTNTQAEDWTRRLEAHGSSREYFTFDHTLFPEVVE